MGSLMQASAPELDGFKSISFILPFMHLISPVHVSLLFLGQKIILDKQPHDAP